MGLWIIMKAIAEDKPMAVWHLGISGSSSSSSSRNIHQHQHNWRHHQQAKKQKNGKTNANHVDYKELIGNNCNWMEMSTLSLSLCLSLIVYTSSIHTVCTYRVCVHRAYGNIRYTTTQHQGTSANINSMRNSTQSIFLLGWDSIVRMALEIQYTD